MGLYALFKKLKLAFKIFLVHLPTSKYWRRGAAGLGSAKLLVRDRTMPLKPSKEALRFCDLFLEKI
jgi:hypothetical protein